MIMSFVESTNDNHQILNGLDNSTNLIDSSPWKKQGTTEISISNINASSKVVSRLPSKISINDISQHGELIDIDHILTIERHNNNTSMIKDIDRKEQFDNIVTNVNNAIQELNQIYHKIGYSCTEISTKKSEIFTTIQETINNFASNLRREKNNIESECEWLRQQIRIILAMINDNNGDNTISLMNRGIVFNNSTIYEQGYKDEIHNKLSNLQNKQNFYQNSPFNISSTNITDNDFPAEIQYEYMLKNTPQLSLLQSKSRLNFIFLEVLQTFIGSFKKLNDLNIKYLDITDIIGQLYSSNAIISMLKTLPNKDEAEHHKELINQFETVLQRLNVSNDSRSETLLCLNEKNNNNQNEFIIPSPCMEKTKNEKRKEDINDSSDTFKENKKVLMINLRNINYQIVRTIRSLKLKKITPEILSSIEKEIEFCEKELNERNMRMKNIINKCLDLLSILNLNEDQIINIQKQYNIINTKDIAANEGFFDCETLKFIQSNPKRFGLQDIHLNFINKFANALQKIKDLKQRKLNFYLDSCCNLWDKLGEPSEYIDNFVNANNSLSEMSLMNFKMELNRLYVKRSEFIESFIINTRIEIEKLWDKMYYSNDERTKFKYYNYDATNNFLDKEVVLNEHETELARLESEYEEKNIIFTLNSQLNELIQDQEFLKKSSKDSSRLLSKNSCKILLNEEKIRKKISKNMPKLIENLKSEIIKLNDKQSSEGKRPITINGEDFFERLLVIEKKQCDQNSKKPRIKLYIKQESPSKSSKNLGFGSSPIKSNSKFPSIITSRTSSFNITKVPITMRRSFSACPSIKNQFSMKRPILNFRSLPKMNHQKMYNNSTASKLSDGINTSLRTDSTLIDLDGLNKFLSTQLQPLNSPLVSENLQNNVTQIQKASYKDNHCSSILSSLNFSPLKINHNATNNANPGTNKLQNSSNQEALLVFDKENFKFELSPVKISDFMNLVKKIENNNASSNGINNITCDSSTVIGEDYQIWRDEKIRQLKNLT